mmetsp:Transcript_3274/g.7279  ORF Transcript_3274/g.7279 Transcript_3274/m.7279 type:complete len:110 (-) Transcript_3274:53-382(-)
MAHPAPQAAMVTAVLTEPLLDLRGSLDLEAVCLTKGLLAAPCHLIRVRRIPLDPFRKILTTAPLIATMLRMDEPTLKNAARGLENITGVTPEQRLRLAGRQASQIMSIV